MTTEINVFDKLEAKHGRLTFGRFLRSWREADELSQKRFAKQLGMSVQNLCDLEKGRRIPSASRAAKIARKLGVGELPLITLVLRDSLYAEGFNFDVKLIVA